jgi:hypothetical protein
MILWSLCAFIWFENMKKMLLQMTSDFLQLESTLFMWLVVKISRFINILIVYIFFLLSPLIYLDTKLLIMFQD